MAEPRHDPAGAVVGTVVDEAGVGLEGVHLVTEPHGYEATSAEDGRFRIGRLAPDQYALIAASSGFATEVLDAVAVDGDAETEVALVLHPSRDAVGQIAVRVLGPDDLPLAGVNVEDGLGQQVQTDAAGEAVLVGLAGQRVDLSVRDPADAVWPRTRPGLVVPALGNLQVELQLSGRPPVDAVPVGSFLCANCHPDQGAAHSDTAHAHALSETVDDALTSELAAGPVVSLGGGSAAVSDAPEVAITPLVGTPRTFRVDGWIGSAGRGTVPYTVIGDQAWPLPIAWVAARPELGSWPDAQARWVPFEEDRWLDGTGAFTFAAGSAPDPATSADGQCFACHATGLELAPRPDGGVDLTASWGSGERWSEPGVGCERCHGPGSAHVGAPGPERAFRITRPDLLDTDRANAICAQCHGQHQSLSGGLPFPYDGSLGLFRPGHAMVDFATSSATSWPSGAADRPGSQADELELSAHGEGGPYALRCVDCHTPHGALRADDRDNALCASCHLSWTWEGDQVALEEHPGHFGGYDPAGPQHLGRCTGCHMPATASRLSWSPLSGAGDLDSHLFVALPPQDAIEAFDAQGATTLEVGQFPVHACAECHEWGVWREAEAGGTFIGPFGDPTDRAIHQLYQRAYDLRFP